MFKKLLLCFSLLATQTQVIQSIQLFNETIGNTLITVCSESRYDISSASTQAIVNPANSMLGHYAGVAWAISCAAGEQLQEWSDAIPLENGVVVPLGQAVISPSFNLKAKGIEFIVHTVGPDFRDPVQQQEGAMHLYNAWYNALVVAHNYGIRSITFPSISTGIFNCPQDLAAQQAYCAIHDFLRDYPETSIKKIVIGLWSDTWDAYKTYFSVTAPEKSKSIKKINGVFSCLQAIKNYCCFWDWL